jgi:hypothetical protein
MRNMLVPSALWPVTLFVWRSRAHLVLTCRCAPSLITSNGGVTPQKKMGRRDREDNKTYNVRGFAPKGKTPIVRLHAKRSSINMISSIINQGKVRFMLYRKTMTAPALIKLMFVQRSNSMN